jgi:hypothetical protein
MVEIRPPADGAVPPPSTIGSASIEIGPAVMPKFDDFVMPTSNVAAPPAVLAPAVPETAAVASPSRWLWWGIGGASVLAASGLAAVVLSGGRESTPPQSTPAAQSTQASSATSNTTAITAEQLPATATDANPVETPTATPEPQPNEAAASAEPKSPAKDLPPTPTPAPTETEPVAEAVKEKPATPVAATTTPQATALTEEKPRPRPVMSLDPLDFDPSQFSFSGGDSKPAASGPGSIPKNAEVVANVDATIPDPEKAPVPEAPKVDRSLTMRLGPMPDGNAPPQRIAEQLGTRVESFAVKDMPLSRFVETISDLADIAVTLDPFELELAGVTLGQKVTIDSKEVTVEKVLRDVLATQRLDLVERNGQLGIALAGGDARREISYDVADLAGAEDATSIANLVQRFVAPDSWTAAGGGGTIEVEKSTLRIEQSQRVRHELFIFCERLRLARGLSQRSRYPASLLTTASPYAAASPLLKQPATFTLLPWTRLADAVRHWQDASKLTILVDWRALAELDLGPSSPVACSANNRTWEDTLDRILEPLDLAWWPAGGETIQITSRDALDNIRRIDFYEVPKTLRDQHPNNAALMESLQKELADIDGPSPPVMEIDEPSSRLIVLASPSTHRELSKRLSAPAK